MTDDGATLDDAPAVTAKRGGGEARSEGLPETHDAAAATALTINRPADELFAYFRDFTRLASFMENVERVDVTGNKTSHWVVKAPGGGTVEWDAEIVEERDGELIAWRSTEDADVPNSGRIEFRAAGERGTVVTATIAYDPPAGVVGKLVAKVFQREPAIQARRDLRRFKQLMETGEIATGARSKAQQDEGKN